MKLENRNEIVTRVLVIKFSESFWCCLFFLIFHWEVSYVSNISLWWKIVKLWSSCENLTVWNYTKYSSSADLYIHKPVQAKLLIMVEIFSRAFWLALLSNIWLFSRYVKSYDRVFFITVAPLKVLSVRLYSKSDQKSSKCENF